MYIKKDELIRRLTVITGKKRSEFESNTVEQLRFLYDKYDTIEERVYFEVPYKEKGIVKLLGAMYDGEKKKWYVPNGADINIFKKWQA